MIQVKGEMYMNESIGWYMLTYFGLVFVALVVFTLIGWIFYSVQSRTISKNY